MICKRVLILHQGQIVAEKSMDDLSSVNALNLDLRGSSGAIQEILNRIKGINKVTAQGNNYAVSLAGDTNTQEINPVVVKSLIEADIKIVQIQDQASTLEEIFIDAISQESEVSNG